MLVVAIAAIVTLMELTSEGQVTSNPETEQGYELIGRNFPPTPESEYVNELVLIRSTSLNVDDAGFRDKVAAVLDDVRTSAVVHNARSFYESGDTALVSENRQAMLIPIGLIGDCEEGADTLIRIVQAADAEPFDVAISGECSVDRDLNRILDDDLKSGELYFGIPAALVILVLVFGALGDRACRDAASGRQPRRIGRSPPGSGGSRSRPGPLGAGHPLLPDEAPSKAGSVALEEEFGVGTVDSAIVVVEGDVTASPLKPALRRLVRTLGSDPDFSFPELEISPDRRLAVVEALVAGDSRDRRTLTAVRQLRERDVPEIFDGLGATVLVTGETAEEIDYTDLMETWLPRIIAFVRGSRHVCPGNHRARDHGRRAHHHRRVHGLRERRARGVATGRLRSGHCAADRRDDRALSARSLEHEAPRSLELVPAELARLATRPARRSRDGVRVRARQGSR